MTSKQHYHITPPTSAGGSLMSEDKTIYFLRHGDMNGGGLTAVGAQQVRASSSSIKADVGNTKMIVLYHCRHLRIKQSAEITRETLAPINVVLQERNEMCLDLSPDEKSYIDEIIAISPTPVIMVVHQPDLEDFLMRLKNQGFYQGETIIRKGDYVKVTVPAAFLSAME